MSVDAENGKTSLLAGLTKQGELAPKEDLSMSVGKISSAVAQERVRRLALSFTASLMIEAI